MSYLVRLNHLFCSLFHRSPLPEQIPSMMNLEQQLGRQKLEPSTKADMEPRQCKCSPWHQVVIGSPVGHPDIPEDGPFLQFPSSCLDLSVMTVQSPDRLRAWAMDTSPSWLWVQVHFTSPRARLVGSCHDQKGLPHVLKLSTLG